MLTSAILLVLALVAGLYMAWNIGANDVANAVGTSVGSKAITLRQAVLIAGVFEFSGALLVGGGVAQTIRRGIVDVDRFRAGAAPEIAAARPSALSDAGGGQEVVRGGQATHREDPVHRRLAIGMLSALLGAAVWLNVATFFSQPVSTTHAIVGAVVGFALAAAGPACVVWSQMGVIAASWVISPVVGALLAYGVYRLVQRFVLRSRHPVFMAKRAVPVGFGTVAFIMSLSVVYKVMRLGPAAMWRALPVAIVIGVLAAAIARAVLVRRSRARRVRLAQRYEVVERWFGRVQVTTACYLAFAHGANDVANAIGPLAAVVHYAIAGSSGAHARVPVWLLALGGGGIVLGVGTYGYKVIEAVGRRITEITPTRGFAAQFGTATSVLVCSLLGMPVSTTLVLVGAVMGVGLARGFAAIDMKVIRRIFASWIITIPASAFFGAVFYWILTALAG